MGPEKAIRPMSDTVWYLAYGSNMSRAKFTGSRGIEPLASARVRVPRWMLALNIPGLPYSEPTFTSIVPLQSAIEPSAPGGDKARARALDCLEAQEPEKTPEVLGVAYLITDAQYIKVLASEGGGIAYTDIELRAVPLGDEDADRTGGEIVVRTLGNAMVREPWPRPSQRYMDIVTTGAREAGMPDYWQKYLQDIAVYRPPTCGKQKVGAAIFLAFWGPIMGLMEKITNATMQEDGYAPPLVIWLVRTTMWLIWFTHDTFFAPLCGNGDGRIKDEARQVQMFANEKDALLGQRESR